MKLHQLLFQAFQLQRRVLSPVREELGLGSGQPKILTYLNEFGPSSQNDIALYFMVDPASISRMSESLCRGGFITRMEDSCCRRANILALTEQGKEACKRWDAACKKVEGELLKDFSGEEAKELVSYLERIIANGKEGL